MDLRIFTFEGKIVFVSKKSKKTVKNQRARLATKKPPTIKVGGVERVVEKMG